MVLETDQQRPSTSTMSGFLGLRGGNRVGAASTGVVQAHRSVVTSSRRTRGDQDEAMSIISVASSNNFWTKHHAMLKQKHAAAAPSVMSDVSSHSTILEENEYLQSAEMGDNSPSNEFIIQCKNGEMIFIPNGQGRVIKSRCRHFRFLLSTGRGGHIIVGGDEKKDDDDDDNRILKKDNWTIGTARHVIELLTDGTTWIENDQRRFVELAKACEEIEVRLCLGSMINYHDILDQASTYKFFDLINIDKYQFKLQGIVKSFQWMHLLHKGILLLLKSKILMITVAPPTDGTAELPTSAKSSKIVTKLSPSVPNQDRLTKCDDLYSEFCVYSNGCKINALLTILDLLSKTNFKEEMTTTNVVVDKAQNSTNKEHQHQQRKMLTAGPRAPEQFKIVYKTRIGSIEVEDLNMLWRLTSASYTLSTPEERQYMIHCPTLKDDAVASTQRQESGDTVHTPETEDNTDGSSNSGRTITSYDSVHSESHSPIQASTPPATATAPTPTPDVKYQFRTLTGTSCMVLKHLFDPLNNATTTKTATTNNVGVDESQLPALIMVSNPTPDTLGRFLNAASHTSGICSSTEIGWDVVSSTSTIFYVATTTQTVKEIVNYLADYSSSAIVTMKTNDTKSNKTASVGGGGSGGDFRFKQHTTM
jgi:hypothetical protein